MRIIRTEILLDPNTVTKTSNRSASINPGISFAFLEGDRRFERFMYDYEFDMGELIFSQSIHLERRPKERDYYDTALVLAIEASLRGAPLMALAKNSYTNPNRLELASTQDFEIHNTSLVQYILDTNIVVEHSPPEWLAVRDLLKFGPVVGGGMAIGVYATSQPIVLITVPFGIVLMGSAVAIAKSFEKGLPRVIDEKILRRRRGR